MSSCLLPSTFQRKFNVGNSQGQRGQVAQQDGVELVQHEGGLSDVMWNVDLATSMKS